MVGIPTETSYTLELLAYVVAGQGPDAQKF